MFGKFTCTHHRSSLVPKPFKWIVDSARRKLRLSPPVPQLRLQILRCIDDPFRGPGTRLPPEVTAEVTHTHSIMQYPCIAACMHNYGCSWNCFSRPIVLLHLIIIIILFAARRCVLGQCIHGAIVRLSEHALLRQVFKNNFLGATIINKY